MERSKYYVPRTKKELVNWCRRRFPFATTIWGEDFEDKSKKQLYAIYYGAIKKHEGVTK